jgi:hypothetical protein
MNISNLLRFYWFCLIDAICMMTLRGKLCSHIPIIIRLIYRPYGAIDMSPLWGYEHGAPMGLLTYRPDGAICMMPRWGWGCGASVMQNLTDNTNLSYQATAGQNLYRIEGVSSSEPRRGGTIKTRLPARFRFGKR